MIKKNPNDLNQADLNLHTLITTQNTTVYTCNSDTSIICSTYLKEMHKAESYENL